MAHRVTRRELEQAAVALNRAEGLPEYPGLHGIWQVHSLFVDYSMYGGYCLMEICNLQGAEEYIYPWRARCSGRELLAYMVGRTDGMVAQVNISRAGK